MKFFILMNTVKDKESAGKAAAEIRNLAQILARTSSANTGDAYLRQGYELKKRLITHQYYLSDDLETVMYDPDIPFGNATRTDMGGILFLEFNIPPPKPIDKAPDIRPETEMVVQKYNKICSIFDTIHDKKSADQAAAAILDPCWEIADLHHQLDRLSP